VLFAKHEGILPAPEANHAVKGAIEEALKAKAAGTAPVILFNLCGHGHFDMAAYEKFNAGEMVDSEFSDQVAPLPNFHAPHEAPRLPYERSDTRPPVHPAHPPIVPPLPWRRPRRSACRPLARRHARSGRAPAPLFPDPAVPREVRAGPFQTVRRLTCEHGAAGYGHGACGHPQRAGAHCVGLNHAWREVTAALPLVGCGAAGAHWRPLLWRFFKE
jgi:hypothetical protein